MMTSFSAFKEFRAEASRGIGKEAFNKLHQNKPLIDWFFFLTITTLLFSLAYALFRLPFGVTWIICLTAQGFVMQAFGLFAHDAFTHRKLGGKKISYYCDLFCTIPYFRLPTQYYDMHIKHHRHLNTTDDPEIQILRSMGKLTRIKKILLMTLAGAILVELNGVNSLKSTPHLKKKINKEKKVRIAYVICIITSTYFFPAFFIYGYWVPLLLTAPPITMYRILLEHGDTNPDNPIQAATNYRSKLFFQLLHVFDSGDCHLIHHIYPNIPFYNIRKAIKLLRPYLEKRGVYEYTSSAPLLKAIFVDDKSFRTRLIEK